MQRTYKDLKGSYLLYICDNRRHLICAPLSIKNLHRAARELGIKRCWFHGDHYDIPKRRVAEIMKKCKVVSPKIIAIIIRGLP